MEASSTKTGQNTWWSRSQVTFIIVSISNTVRKIPGGFPIFFSNSQFEWKWWSFRLLAATFATQFPGFHFLNHDYERKSKEIIISADDVKVFFLHFLSPMIFWKILKVTFFFARISSQWFGLGSRNFPYQRWRWSWSWRRSSLPTTSTVRPMHCWQPVNGQKPTRRQNWPRKPCNSFGRRFGCFKRTFFCDSLKRVCKSYTVPFFFLEHRQSVAVHFFGGGWSWTNSKSKFCFCLRFFLLF